MQGGCNCRNNAYKVENKCDMNCGCGGANSNYNSNSKKELMEIITQASFALDDIKLYLNTHPCDEAALKAYEDYKKIRKVAIMEYTKEHGPISAYDVEVCNYWDWVNKPWPWEGEC